MYIKQNGNRLFLVCTFLFIMVAVFCLMSCGIGDWIYENLPGDYEIWRINADEIILCKKNGYGYVVDNYVLEFCYSEVYIGVKQVAIDDNIPCQDININELDKSNPDYYLIDAKTDTVYGPYSAEEYESQVETLEIIGMCDWIPTVPKPDGAK